MRGTSARSAGKIRTGTARTGMCSLWYLRRLYIQSLPYEEQLSMKEQQVKDLIDAVITEENKGYEFLPIKASPRPKAYRNKMEFSFGDEYKDGPLALGMHKRAVFMIS